MSVADGHVGAGVLVTVDTKLVTSVVAVHWSLWGSTYMGSCGGACIIGGHTFEHMVLVEAVVSNGPACWFIYFSGYTLLAESGVEYLYTVHCVCGEVSLEGMSVCHHGEYE